MSDIKVIVDTTRLAPLYRAVAGSKISPLAYLEFAPSSATVSFGNRMHRAKTEDEQRGLLYRWPIPSAIRSSHCITVANSLRPLLQEMTDGFFENVEQAIGSEYITSGHLLPRAERARLQIGRLLKHSLIDVSDRHHVVSVCSSDEFVRERVADRHAILPTAMDVGLYSIALKYRCEADEEGLLITGSLMEALCELRERSQPRR